MVPVITALFTAAVLILAPQKPWDAHTELPQGQTETQVPFANVKLTCALLGADASAGGTWAGCHIGGVGIVLPTRDSFPYRADCWDMNRRHEIAHAWGWLENHPGARAFTCNPKD